MSRESLLLCGRHHLEHYATTEGNCPACKLENLQPQLTAAHERIKELEEEKEKRARKEGILTCGKHWLVPYASIEQECPACKLEKAEQEALDKGQSLLIAKDEHIQELKEQLREVGGRISRLGSKEYNALVQAEQEAARLRGVISETRSSIKVGLGGTEYTRLSILLGKALGETDK